MRSQKRMHSKPLGLQGQNIRIFLANLISLLLIKPSLRGHGLTDPPYDITLVVRLIKRIFTSPMR